jgi:AbrB family looped-hinge helix DNA binding protein
MTIGSRWTISKAGRAEGSVVGSTSQAIRASAYFLEGKWYSPTGGIAMARTSFLTLDQKGRATFPEEVRAALGIGAGDLILLERTERGTFELVPATLVPSDQLWFHHPEVQKRVAKAESDFTEGRATRTETPEEAASLLDRLKQPRSSKNG